jgi:hypothetical protein
MEVRVGTSGSSGCRRTISQLVPERLARGTKHGALARWACAGLSAVLPENRYSSQAPCRVVASAAQRTYPLSTSLLWACAGRGEEGDDSALQPRRRLDPTQLNSRTGALIPCGLH